MGKSKKKSEDNSDILEQNFFQEKSKFEIAEEKIKKTLFGVLNILLKFDDDDEGFSGEVVGLLNETCQFLCYPFYDPMGYLWKKPQLFNVISKFLSYFQTVVFFNNTELYTVVFYLIIVMILGVVADVCYVAYIISSNNKSGAVWPMSLLRSVVSYIVTVMFNPLVEYLLAILECSDKDEEGNQLSYYQNYNVDDMHCWTNPHFTVMCVLAVIITFIFIIICTVVMTIFYEQKTSADIDGAKTSSTADLVVLFVKIALILIYSFLVWTKGYHWVVVPGTTLLAFLQFYIYWVERPFYEEKMNYAFFIHTGIVFFSTVVLLLTKVLEKAAFDGGIFLFFIGCPIVSYIIITQKDQRFSELLTNINKFDKGDYVFRQIRYFLELADKKGKHRQSNILLKGYIYVHEETCTLLDCPLKKYLKECEKYEKQNVNVNGTATNVGIDSVNNIHQSNALTQIGGGTTLLNTGTSTNIGNMHNEADLYLFQYAMIMYQNGISKFPSCTTLRMNYSFFLMERMNNRKKALIELKNCDKYNPSFEEEFIIFRFCENQAGDGGDDDDDDDEDGLDIVSAIAYRNHLGMFKEGLTNITSIYSEFWNLLLNNTQKTEEDLMKMNEYGEKINSLLEDIKGHYSEMEKLKYNDEEVLTLYSDFFQEILNDRSQAEYYRGRLRDIQGNEDGPEGGEGNDMLDINGDDFDYIFLSAEGTNMGKIIKCSLGICQKFGYIPTDLIGKNINHIMPDMYQELHKQVLVNKLNKFKTQMTQNFRNGIKNSQKASFREIFVFGKNKLKHAIPLAMKVTLLTTQDQSELFFAARITNEELYIDFNAKNPSLGIPSIINFEQKVCFVLTDLNFIIQYYTPNAIGFLGFKSNTSGNTDITKSISDLNNNEDRPDFGKVSKNEIFKKKYFEPKVIIWKTLLSEEDEALFRLDSATDKINMKGLMNYSRKIMLNKNSPKKQLSNKGNSRRENMQFMPIRRQRYKEDYFNLSVSEISLLNQAVGYIFRFEVVEMEDNDLDGFDDKNLMPITTTLSKMHSQTQLDFNPNYIPEVTKKFDLDTRKLGFFSKETNVIQEEEFSSHYSENEENENNQVKRTENWHLKLKEFANEKIEKFKKQFIIEEEEEEEEEDESDYSSNEESSSSNINTNINSENRNLLKQTSLNSSKNNLTRRMSSTRTSKLFKRNTITDNPNYECAYYHVKNINNIKFSIFDFKKQRLIDVPKIRRESQVEYKKKENLPDFFSKKDDNNNKKIKEEDNDDNGEEEISETDAVHVKQIEYALRKEEFQPEIVKLKYISLILYIGLIIITSVLLSLFINDSTITRENLRIIKDNRDLINHILNGLYYIRELTLLNNEKYKVYLYNKDYMYENITGILGEIFEEAYQFQQNILTTYLEMTKGRKNFLLEGDVSINTIEEDLTVKEIILNFNTALTQMLTSIFQIKNTPLDKIIQTNSYVYYYTTNCFNPITNTLLANFDSFTFEFFDKIKDFKNEHLYIIILSLIILIVGGIAIKIVYDQISKRKSSYLEVFFEIDESVCKKALDKCENYANVLHPLIQGDQISNEEEEESIDKKKIVNKKNSDVKKNKTNTKEKYQNLSFIIKLSFICLIAFGYYLTVILFFQYSLENIQTYVEMYNITAYKSEIYNCLFDDLREYFFDKNEFTGNMKYKLLLEKKLNYIYEYIKEESKKFSVKKLPKTFRKRYQGTILGNLCSYTRDLFTNDIYNNYLIDNGYTCTSATGNSSDYGLNVFVSYYLQKIRTQKNLYDFIIGIGESLNFEYNNTLYGTKFQINNNDESYIINDPFQVFNYEDIFLLSIMRRFYVDPIYDSLLQKFYESIYDYWSSKYHLCSVLIVLLIIGITLFFAAYIIPFIYKLDQDIYKTKNMLSIIPKEVLASLRNISVLLNLSNAVKPTTSTKNKKKEKEKEEKIINYDE